jgi:hypothetical protein
VPHMFKVWRRRSIFNRAVVLRAIKRPSPKKSLNNLFSVVCGMTTHRFKDRLKISWIEIAPYMAYQFKGFRKLL